MSEASELGRADFGDLRIDTRQVAKLARCGPGARWDVQIEAAIEEARTLAEPRARYTAVSGRGLDGIFASETPVQPIVRAGEATLFSVTVGSRLQTKVKEYFAANSFLEGVLLDAAASMAVEAVCDQVEARIAGPIASARFSPGYCSWAVASQPGIFALLEPERIGIELLPSMLMTPLKSVSGVVVVSHTDNLAVPAHECASCEAKGCTRRRSPL